MAIELFPSVTGDEPEKHNEMTDIWALGMVAYELLSWSVPYKEMSNDVLVMMAIVNGKLPATPKAEEGSDTSIFDRCWELAQSCWHKDMYRRPTAEELSRDLSLVEPIQNIDDARSSWPPLPEGIIPGRKDSSDCAAEYEGDVTHCPSPRGSGKEFLHLCRAKFISDPESLNFRCEPRLYLHHFDVELDQAIGESERKGFRFQFKISAREGVGGREHTHSNEPKINTQLFRVRDTNEASAWVLALEKSRNVTVRMQNPSPASMVGLVRRLISPLASDEHESPSGNRSGKRKREHTRVRFFPGKPSEIPLPAWLTSSEEIEDDDDDDNNNTTLSDDFNSRRLDNIVPEDLDATDVNIADDVEVESVDPMNLVVPGSWNMEWDNSC